jgi:hypothetical protein
LSLMSLSGQLRHCRGQKPRLTLVKGGLAVLVLLFVAPHTVKAGDGFCRTTIFERSAARDQLRRLPVLPWQLPNALWVSTR